MSVTVELGCDLSVEVDTSVNDIVGVLNSQHAALVDRVVVLLADERLWAGEGMTSMSAWVAWRAGMSPAMARSVVAIAERVAELPASIEAFRRGELSLDQMAAQSSVEEFLSLWQDDDGSFRLSGRLDADAGMAVHAALDEARDRLFQRGDFGAGLAEALIEMAQASLDSVADPARRSRFRVNLFINTDSHERNMADAAGWNVPDAIRRYLTCNGTLTPVLLDNGLPVSVGRAQYVVPARTRTVIEHRDRGACRVPGCDATLGLEVHHLIHWEHGGRTDTDNLLLVCGKHHRMHHRGRLDITGNANQPDGLEFRNQHGRIITPSGATPNPPTGPPPKPAAVYSHPDGRPMDTGQIYFNPPRTSYDNLRQRTQTDTEYSDSEYLAKIQPPGLR
jgi:hypothetical protein